jgi:hypothetical protein
MKNYNLAFWLYVRILYKQSNLMCHTQESCPNFAEFIITLWLNSFPTWPQCDPPHFNSVMRGRVGNTSYVKQGRAYS